MPQMSPMWWSILYIYMFLTYFYFFPLIYFNFKYKIFMKSNIKFIKKYFFKW
nr:ATP synthase subunit 8 [Diodontus sp. a EB-2023]WRY74203.1 ATP synthase subunit 8 [Diodontus sp. a EB-2023]WRY74210.1 ATP synthase subunit 8 [Diodontus sp. a EB-2023]